MVGRKINQGKGNLASRHSHCHTIRGCNQWCEPLLHDHCWWTRPSCGEDNWCEWSILHFNYSFHVSPSLFFLMASVAHCNGWVRLVDACGLNTVTSKYAHCLSLPLKSWALTLGLVLSSTLVVLCGDVSPVSGSGGGSTLTFAQNMESSWAVTSWIRLCQIEG